MAERAIELVSASEAATRRLGEALGRLLRAGDLVLLAGPFSAGKTVFTKGIAAGLGIADEVTSPSFALVQEYAPADLGRPPLFHMDLYRLGSGAEARGLGLDEYLADGITVIEWPDVAAAVLPDDRLRIEFEHAGADRRRLRARAFGARAAEILKAWRTRQRAISDQPSAVRRRVAGAAGRLRPLKAES